MKFLRRIAATVAAVITVVPFANAAFVHDIIDPATGDNVGFIQVPGAIGPLFDCKPDAATFCPGFDFLYDEPGTALIWTADDVVFIDWAVLPGWSLNLISVAAVIGAAGPTLIGTGNESGATFDGSLTIPVPVQFVPVHDVPEPATSALFGFGLAALWVGHRRRKKR